MAHDALSTFNSRRTLQSEQADPRQRKNAAGGFTFQIDELARLRRFLFLGTDGGTYYTDERDLTRENAQIVVQFATDRCTELVNELLAISLTGRAPRQNPTLFALAAAVSFGDVEGKKAAAAAFNQIVRTGTQLFIFTRYAKQFRGWGRGLRRVVAHWYNDRSADDLAYQLVKYRQREGMTHRDLLRLAHPDQHAPTQLDLAARRALYDWVCRRPHEDAPAIVHAYELAQILTTPREWAALIEGSQVNLPWEVFPDAALTSPSVWEALIARGLPQTALMRQLPRLTRLGVLKPMSSTLAMVCTQLADPERLRKGRIHPINVLVATKTYTSGRSERGSSTWDPIPQVAGALNQAFYNAYGAVPTTGKRHLLALDVSGSMGSACGGLSMLSCREASAAIALVTANVEPTHHIVGFTASNGASARGYARTGNRYQATGAELTPLDISPRQRLDDAVARISNIPFGATDCSLPMQYALHNQIEVDCFTVYTDNETWYGEIHPHQALRDYREQTGIDAKLVVVSMTATGDSIADPTDPSMLDVAGFDSAVPSVISEFASGAVSGR